MAGTDLYPVAGSKFYVGGVQATQVADFTAADFAAQSWVEVDGWSTMGNVGDAAQVITTALINRGRDVKQKGTRNAGSMQNVFAKLPSDPGQIALVAAEKTSSNYAFKVQFDDAPAAESHAVTVTIATPGVFTWTAHGLLAGDAVKLATTGALPTGLTAGTTYYVVPIDDDTFSLSATNGGSAIVTSGTQSGVHTITTVGSPSLMYFVGLVTTTQQAGGAANTVQNLNITVEINSNVVEVLAAA